jgi:nucleoside-diphosphate-sugar epimerase
VLEACVESKIRRLVFMSSIDALGIFQGEGRPLYLPLDDGYPCHPTLVYSVSKKLGEELCERFAGEEKIRIAAFRVPGVWTEETYRIIQSKRRENPEYEWSPYWEYGAFIDVRDLAAAIRRAMEKDLPGYTCLTLASDDITSSGRTSLQLVRALHPTVSWKGGPEYGDDPYRSLIDCGTAKHLLDWRPEHSWKSFIASASRENPAWTRST